MQMRKICRSTAGNSALVPVIMALGIALLMISVVNQPATGQVSGLTANNITFIHYPGFPRGNSTWGDIGYNPKNKAVFVGVTNHVDSVGLYEYNISANRMELKGFISDLANLRDFQWQGKIHSKIVTGPDGAVYFTTDGGEMRHLDFMDGPHGYAGGYFMKWDPAEGRLTNLGMGLQYESLKDMDIDPETGLLYAITFPQVHFIVYDPETNKLRDLGRLGSGHVPRVLFTDWWGNCYYTDWRQRLVKFEKSSDKLIFARESLPSFPGTPGTHILTGITAYAKNMEKNIIYLITYGGKILAFYPEMNGIGKVADLGGVFDSNKKEDWDYYVPNLNCAKNGNLYYFIGGHGNFAIQDKTVLVEFNPASRQKRIIYEFPVDSLAEVTGSDVRDSEGNLYYAGRLEVTLPVPDRSAKDPLAFMIKFNPDKEVKP